MAGWISSKLKVAEDFLQQIDHQAAESFGRKEQTCADESNDKIPERSSTALSLMHQLKKKTPQTDDFIGKSLNDSNLNFVSNINGAKQAVSFLSQEIATSISSPRPALMDSDWEELLNSPSESIFSQRTSGNRSSASRSSRKVGVLHKSLSSRNLDLKKLKNSSNVSASKPVTKEYTIDGGDMSSEKMLNSASGSSNTEAKTERSLEGKQINYNSRASDIQEELRHESNPNGIGSIQNKMKLLTAEVHQRGLSSAFDENGPPSSISLLTDDSKKPSNQEHVGDGIREPSSSSSNERLDSDVGSSSDSSEEENEESRRRREEIMVARAKAKAACAIKERENVVARLEGEKQCLEKILDERLKHQAVEASELQLSTLETVEAVEKEKQLHNSTRMEALARVAKLEIANADLAKSFASAQRNLEVVAVHVLDLRQQANLKQLLLEELNNEISNAHKARSSIHELSARKEVKLEREIQKAEYDFINDKVAQLQNKAKTLEESIKMIREGMESPTEVENKLKRRLDQFTDHLIRKQAQVEGLSSEKAMFLLRIEGAKESSGIDLESGKWNLPDPDRALLLQGKLQLWQKQLVSVIRQLDAMFSLHRSTKVKIFFVMYLLSLHFWAIYIFMGGSKSSDVIKSAGTMSLENINRTAD